MKMVKRLVLATAAGFVAVGGAQAADLPVKAKAVEYVRVCSLYGAGFYYIPGTDTCIKIGGYLRIDSDFNAGVYDQPAWSSDLGNGDRYRNAFSERSRFALTVDTRTASEYGVVRTFAQGDFQFDTLGGSTSNPTALSSNLGNNTSSILGTPGGGYVAVEYVFIQFAGFTFGKSSSAYSTPWNGYPGNNSSFLIGGNDTVTGVNNIQYTAQFGNGVSASIGLDDPSAFNRTSVYNLSTGASAGLLPGGIGATGTGSNAYGGVNMPDVVANIKVDQAWGLFQLSGALHEVDASYNTLAGSGLTPADAVASTTASMLSGHPDTKYGGSVMAALQIKNIPTGPGDDIKFDATWAKGDTKNVISTSASSPSFAMFGGVPGQLGSSGTMAFGATTDGVYLPTSAGGDGSIHLTTAYGVRGAFNHNWDPYWSSSLFGGMGWVQYDGTAKAEYCAAFFASNPTAGGGVHCDPNFSMSELGFITRWTPVKNLTFSAETIWAHLNTSFSGTTTAAFSPGAPLQTGAYTFKSQDTVSLNFRVQRNF
ncbi:porin [Bradyrhizobium canariense]|uniref:Porin n=1 Tax=Bradyrhizobium canariense TaxID=255045 RepID=A0A1H1P562_9BRAD|nr:porin [Bradyrhizobium canariense]SDS06381.1 Porin subfamily protein [Bradyrhizobium canariense]